MGVVLSAELLTEKAERLNRLRHEVDTSSPYSKLAAGHCDNCIGSVSHKADRCEFVESCVLV